MTDQTAAEGRRTAPRREVWLSSRPDAARASSDSLTVVVCYPESYALGMSNLGYQSAFEAFAAAEGVHCERAFFSYSEPGAGHPAMLPDPGPERLAGPVSDGTPITSLETSTPLGDFDVVAFSVSFEADFLNVVRMLSVSGVPLRSADRSGDDPVVVMGGVCALLNPEPVSAFVDIVAVGDAGALVGPLVASLRASRGSARRERLAGLSRARGMYVPALYDVSTGSRGAVAGFSARDGAPLPVEAAWAGGRGPTGTAVLSPGAFFGDTYLAEVSSGCARGCRFCAAGHIYRPVTFHPVEDVMAGVRGALAHTGKVGLVSAALADHPHAKQLLRLLRDAGVEVTVSSVHSDRADRELAELLIGAGVRTVTLAPETGSERLRRVIGKPVDNEHLESAVSNLAAAGGESLKLYFMVGLPGETPDDVASIPALARHLAGIFVEGRPEARVSVGVSAFVPKPRTPFQWLPMAGEKDIRTKLSTLRRSLSTRPRLAFTSAGPREARREGVLARGGRELADAIELAAVESVPWRAALKRAGVDEASIVDRIRPDDEVFPWDLVRVGLPREKLLASLREARSLTDLIP